MELCLALWMPADMAYPGLYTQLSEMTCGQVQLIVSQYLINSYWLNAQE